MPDVRKTTTTTKASQAGAPLGMVVDAAARHPIFTGWISKRLGRARAVGSGSRDGHGRWR
jgi:hypothetical protein